jgi:hypothetical protein
MKHLIGNRRAFSRRGFMFVVGGLVAVGAVGLGVGVAAGDEETLVYDSVLGRTVPLVYQEALREVEPSTLPEEGDVAFDADVDPSQNPAEDAEIEDTTPAPPTLHLIPLEDSGNIPFPSGIIRATSTYSESDGHLEREIYAGGVGCMYGLPDGASCTPNANTDYEQIGMIIETVDDLDGEGPLYEAPLLLSGTGLLTFRRIAGDTVFFSTESGTFGAYSLTARQATVYSIQAFGSPIDSPPTNNRASAGRTIPVKWRLTDAAGSPVGDPSTFSSVTSGSTTCSASDPIDDVETYAGASGLQYLGDGWWQFNWATPSSYAGQCRVMRLNLAGPGIGPTALFEFR